MSDAAQAMRHTAGSGGTADRYGEADAGWFRSQLMPAALVVLAPILIILPWIAAVHYDGSLWAMVTDPAGIVAHWPLPSWTAFGMFAAWVGTQLALMLVLPGKRHLGPITPMGEQPAYKLNGVSAFVVTHALWWLGGYVLELFDPATVYAHFGSLLMTLSLFAFVFCVFLYFKGSHFPSSRDASKSGNVIWDFYWGVELHPRLFGVDLKQLFNCRVAMMGWSVILLSYTAAQHQMYGQVSNAMLVSVGLQIVYILKFFYWEGGYFNTIDIMHDRFGFYICWGVLAWLPSIYTVTGLYLVTHPIELPTWLALGIFGAGIAAILVNYQADAQRQRVRATGGATTIWGKTPETIRARYTTATGEEHENLLLVSGWWGRARHFNYLAELTLAFMWTVPALFGHLLPWLYFLFLVVLLVDRARRDELRCRGKYGEFWAKYCEKVPYRIIPYVY
ncbi:MAG: 7-dehydrocholesterol reductase [Myxococcota bacterium]